MQFIPYKFYTLYERVIQITGIYLSRYNMTRSYIAMHREVSLGKRVFFEGEFFEKKGLGNFLGFKVS